MITNQSKYWILELLQKEFIKLGLEPILIGTNPNKFEPFLRLDKFSVYCDTREKFTLYQNSFDRLLSRVSKTKILLTLNEALNP